MISGFERRADILNTPYAAWTRRAMILLANFNARLGKSAKTRFQLSRSSDKNGMRMGSRIAEVMFCF
jgi:hypothetical protein